MLLQALPYVLWGCLSLKQPKMNRWVFTFVFVVVLLLLLTSGQRAARRDQLAMAAEDVGIQIIIDPGHGGEDGGATGVNGARESELNLAISLKLRSLLQLCGIEPIMVRQTDISVYSQGAQSISEKKVSDIRNRVKLVNDTPNALLVSIHQNSFPDSRYDGAQVFYADNSGSQSLAAQMQALLRQTLDLNNRREAKPAASSIYLMNHINCTAVLIECGFLSNVEEEARLTTDPYQTQIAAVIAASLVQHLEATNEI